MFFRFCLSMLLVEIKGNLLRFIWLNMHLRFSTIWIFNLLKIFCTLFFNLINFLLRFLYSSLSGFLRLLGILRYFLFNLIRVSCGLLCCVGIRHLRFNNFFFGHFVLNFVLFSLWHFRFFLVMVLFFFRWLFFWLHWGFQFVREWIKFFFRFFFRIFFMFCFWSFWFASLKLTSNFVQLFSAGCKLVLDNQPLMLLLRRYFFANDAIGDKHRDKLGILGLCIYIYR